jgi:hypothetical protein
MGKARPETKVSNCQHEWAGGIAIRRTSDGHLECGYCRETFVPASKLSAADEAWHEQEDELQSLRSRLDRALNALRMIDRMDPRYDANEVHHEARTGQGFSWDAHRQVWLNEAGEDLVRDRDYGRVALCNCGSEEGQRHMDGCNVNSPLVVERHRHRYGDDGRCECGEHALGPTMPMPERST